MFGVPLISTLLFQLCLIAPVSSLSYTRSCTSLTMSASGHKSLVGVNLSSKCKLVLASQSPRRREILDMIGLNGQYSVKPSPFDEDEIRDELKLNATPKKYTQVMAERKAHALAISDFGDSSYDLPVIVIGSDTIVDLDGTILEKPSDEENAVKMLQRLSGRKHEVHTGVALYSSINKFSEPVISFTETAEVEFAPLSDDDIKAYVSTREPMDKAGSYGIQGKFCTKIFSCQLI